METTPMVSVGEKNPPDRTSCFGCVPELWAGGFHARGGSPSSCSSLASALGFDIIRGKEMTVVPPPRPPYLSYKLILQASLPQG